MSEIFSYTVLKIIEIGYKLPCDCFSISAHVVRSNKQAMLIAVYTRATSNKTLSLSLFSARANANKRPSREELPDCQSFFHRNLGRVYAKHPIHSVPSSSPRPHSLCTRALAYLALGFCCSSSASVLYTVSRAQLIYSKELSGSPSLRASCWCTCRRIARRMLISHRRSHRSILCACAEREREDVRIYRRSKER